MDKVFIESLDVECTIGVYDWERRIKQSIVLDLEMGFDNRTPAASDALTDTVDYVAVHDAVVAYVEASSHQLLETMVEALSELLLERFPITYVDISVRKPVKALRSRAVGIRIYREKRATQA